MQKSVHNRSVDWLRAELLSPLARAANLPQEEVIDWLERVSDAQIEIVQKHRNARITRRRFLARDRTLTAYIHFRSFSLSFICKVERT